MLKLEVGNKGFYTLKFNNKYIHSKYDPVKESDVFINKHQELLTNKIIVVYGLGLGYHIYNILSKVNENTTIIVFEWNEEVVRICREMGLDLFKRNNVKIFTKNEKFYIKLQEYLKLVRDIIIYKPCLETIKEENIKLYDLINEYDLNRKSIQKNKQLLMENYKNNINCNNKNIKELIKYYKDIKKTYIIIAAGPSLDYSINKLKKYRDDYIIISVGSALMTLNDSGVIPDIITIIDGQKVVENQFKGFNRDDVPLCFLSTASRWAVNKYNGPKYIFFNDNNEDDLVIETGKTVAVAAINIAIKCGAKEIVFLGQDLAYINKKTHSYTYEKMYMKKDVITINDKTPIVKGYDGKQLYTSKAYLYYKKQIENIINDNKKLMFVNCSKGAFIEGAEHIDFERYINLKLDY